MSEPIAKRILDGKRLAAMEHYLTKAQPMPGRTAEIPYERQFSSVEMVYLALGIVPESQEDKWFGVLKDGCIDFYRSWTGQHIYRLTVTRAGAASVHSIIANRDPAQYSNTDDDRDIRTVEMLLEWMLDPATAW